MSSETVACFREILSFSPVKPLAGFLGKPVVWGYRWGVASLLGASLIGASSTAAFSQPTAPPATGGVTIEGMVLDSARKPVADASVAIQKQGSPEIEKTKTGVDGAFVFSSLATGVYAVNAEKGGLAAPMAKVAAPSVGEKEDIELVLSAGEGGPTAETGAGAASSTQAMEFADQPNFTVAGVTDWTAVGGHGSDSSLRTSEALTRETLALEPAARPVANSAPDGKAKGLESKLRAALAESPGSFEANHRLGDFYLASGRYPESAALLLAAYRIDPGNSGNEYDLARADEGAGALAAAREHVATLLAHQDKADWRRLSAEVDEAAGDPLGAVHEYEHAVRLEASEQNYFAWGSELLLHRAVWQAQEVFAKGAAAYPQSGRMLAALGTALFAGARYDEAATRLCQASDLNPADPNPYLFMGKIEMAAPSPLACIERKLARFAREQPESSDANYLYAMALLKAQEESGGVSTAGQAEALLTKAVAIDPKCADAYLELGVLQYSRHDYEKAIDFYGKAIAANPELSEAYYRLGVAYDRVGESSKAKTDFEQHDRIERLQAAAIDRQRREIKQFLVVLQRPPAHAPAGSLDSSPDNR